MEQTITLALTMGDPAGIGPEIACKALSGTRIPQGCQVFIIGDLSVLSLPHNHHPGMKPLRAMRTYNDMDNNYINVLDQRHISPATFRTGEISADCGKASYDYIIKAIELAKSGKIHGVVTNPIHKQALSQAGIKFPGHTEIFASETDTLEYSMMFMLDNVCVVHVTTHCSLREAIDRITKERVYRNIILLNDALQMLGIPSPRIAVGGLNPHAGEGGLFGDEEQQHITPAIVQAQNQGMHVSGPLPPDTVFMSAFKGAFDGIVSMLHDHGFVALKSRDFERGVNITIGLPIIRTSVGHGTAFDIAGKGMASEGSLISAIEAAYRMSLSKLNGL